MLLLNQEQTKNYFLQEMRKISAPACVMFKAPMGAGKTYLIQQYLKELGFADVSSPTFAIHNLYQNSHYSVDHLDLQRLEQIDELESIGFWDLFSNKNNVVLVEWAENLQGHLPPKTYRLYSVEISLSPLHGEQARELKIQQIS